MRHRIRRYHIVEDTLIGLGGFFDILELLLLVLYGNRLPITIEFTMIFVMTLSVLCWVLGLWLKFRKRR